MVLRQAASWLELIHQIECMPLHHAATAHALVFNQAPVMMLLCHFYDGMNV